MTRKPPRIHSTSPSTRPGRQGNSRTLIRILLLMSLGWLASCGQPPAQNTPPDVPAVVTSETTPQTNGHLTDYGESRLQPFAAKLLSQTQRSHIVQLGDSHTAADFFTGSLRTDLQQRYGDAGPGWLPPAWIRGQRSGTLKLDEVSAAAWQLTSSRLQEAPNFPMGGFLLQPLGSGSRVQLSTYTAEVNIYHVRALYLSPSTVPVFINDVPVTWPASEHWQWSAAQPLELPLTLETLDDSAPQLGGWWVDNGQPGVLLSSLGINGATLNMLNKWGADWHASLQALQPDLLILAYGTNEAFNDELDLDQYHSQLTRHLQQLRAQHSHTALLIVGAPDVIKHPSAITCEQRRPAQLTQVQAIQQQVAREQQTLFWDWQAMMGGRCSFSDWQAQGHAQPDGVHFTAAGYQASAQALSLDLEQSINRFAVGE